MPETSIQTSPGLKNLAKAEQLRYVQTMWDQILEQPAEIPVPESHLRLAEERLLWHRDNPSAGRPAFEAIDRLANKSN